MEQKVENKDLSTKKSSIAYTRIQQGLNKNEQTPWIVRFVSLEIILLILSISNGYMKLAQTDISIPPIYLITSCVWVWILFEVGRLKNWARCLVLFTTPFYFSLIPIMFMISSFKMISQSIILFGGLSILVRILFFSYLLQPEIRVRYTKSKELHWTRTVLYISCCLFLIVGVKVNSSIKKSLSPLEAVVDLRTGELTADVKKLLSSLEEIQRDPNSSFLTPVEVDKLSGTIETKENFEATRELKRNMGKMRSAISVFYGEYYGKYPKSLNDLVPSFLPEIPPGNWNYDPKTGSLSSPDAPGY